MNDIKLRNKLKRVAEIVAKEKPKLHFFGLVHRVDVPDRWDLLVSSDKLAPWSMEALKYIAGQLKKALTADEIIRIARIVALPRNNAVIASLAKSDAIDSDEIEGLHPADNFDQTITIWPANGRSQKKVRAS